MTITNESYLKVLKTKEMELVPPEKLDDWISKIPLTKKPRKATDKQCAALLILLYYSGARSAEVIQLQPEDMSEIEFKATDEAAVRIAYQVQLVTVKKGKPLRNVIIPRNKYTRILYDNVKLRPPGSKCFDAFIARGGAAKNTVRWKVKTIAYVRENGELRREEVVEEKEKTYSRIQGNKIYDFINRLTGMPPHFWRHHRLTWMDEKGATRGELAQFKGGKLQSTDEYIAMTSEKKKRYLNYF